MLKAIGLSVATIALVAYLIYLGIGGTQSVIGMDSLREAAESMPKLLAPDEESLKKGSSQAIPSPKDGGAPHWDVWIKNGEVLGCQGYVMDGDTLEGYLSVLELDVIEFLADNPRSVGANDWMMKGEKVYVHQPCWFVRDRLEQLHGRRALYAGSQ